MRISDWSSDVCSAPQRKFRNHTRYAINRLTAWVARLHGCVQELACAALFAKDLQGIAFDVQRSEEHTSELQSLMRISYAVFCLKKKKINQHNHKIHKNTNQT